MATIERIEQDITRLQARIGDRAVEEQFLRAYGRTIQQEIAGHRARIAAAQQAQQPAARQVRYVNGNIVDGVPPQAPQVTPVSAPGNQGVQQTATWEGMLGIGQGIIDAVASIIGAIGQIAAALPGILTQIMPLITKLAPAVILVAVLYAISSIFRLRLNLKWR